METANRKLIRPNLNGAKEQIVARRVQKPKTTPPDQTHAENPLCRGVHDQFCQSFYYLKQMQTKTTMVVVLTDGETLHGVIEWYDKFCLKLTQEDGPNLLLYKPSIKYMYKANP